MVPMTLLLCPQRKKRFQLFANVDLGHLGALLPFTALQLSP